MEFDSNDLFFIKSKIKGERIPLFDVASWKNGLAFKNIDFSNTGRPIIKIAELNNGISANTAYTNGEYEHDVFITKGDLLFSWSGNPQTSIDVYKYNLTDGWLNQHIFKLTPKTIIDKSYLYYVLKSLKQNFMKIATNKQTTGLGHVTLQDIKRISIVLPEMEMQRKIAGVLGALDDKIELNNKINQNLELQAQALFSENLHKKSYPIKPLFDVATIKYGKGLPTNKLTKNGYKVFGGNGIIGYYSEYLYEQPQILISCRGAASGTILESHPFCYVTNNSLVVELTDRRYYEFLKRYLLLNQLHSYATGSAQPQITIDNLKGVEIPYPEYEDIKSLSEALLAISRNSYQNLCENEKLSALRDALLPKLMSGEINVDNADISNIKE